MTVTNLIRSAAVLTALALCGSSIATAQHAAKAQSPMAATHVSTKTPPKTGQAAPSAQPTQPKSSFRGIASKLNTTPDALETAYQAALAANPKLTRGQFVAANVLAANLGIKTPAITTQAILDGLKAGKSIGETLHGLGVSSSDADKAQDDANREIHAAQRQLKDSV
jgi:hypothetical protein